MNQTSMENWTRLFMGYLHNQNYLIERDLDLLISSALRYHHNSPDHPFYSDFQKNMEGIDITLSQAIVAEEKFYQNRYRRIIDKLGLI